MDGAHLPFNYIGLQASDAIPQNAAAYLLKEVPNKPTRKDISTPPDLRLWYLRTRIPTQIRHKGEALLDLCGTAVPIKIRPNRQVCLDTDPDDHIVRQIDGVHVL